jgi:hypothetical protein
MDRMIEVPASTYSGAWWPTSFHRHSGENIEALTQNFKQKIPSAQHSLPEISLYITNTSCTSHAVNANYLRRQL